MSSKIGMSHQLYDYVVADEHRRLIRTNAFHIYVAPHSAWQKGAPNMIKNDSLGKFMNTILLANALLFTIYMVVYLYFMEQFCRLFHFPFWRDLLEVFWPSAIDIITGMRIQIGEGSACMYEVYTLIILSLNVVAMSAYIIYLIMNIKYVKPMINNDIKAYHLITPLLTLIMMILFFLGEFIIDEYNYGNAEYRRGIILSPSSAWGGVWNFFRITIFFGVASYLTLLSITVLAIYMTYRSSDRNTNGRG